jgi:hypothetical protein
MSYHLPAITFVHFELNSELTLVRLLVVKFCCQSESIVDTEMTE